MNSFYKVSPLRKRISHILENGSQFYIPRRYRYKKKWAANSKLGSNCQLALNNFDAFYKPYFGKEWPSIRLSLLSLQKYCAAVNKYGSVEQISKQFERLNVANFIEHARTLKSRMSPLIEHSPRPNTSVVSSSTIDCSSRTGDFIHESESYSQVNNVTKPNTDQRDVLEPYAEASYTENLNVFVPTEQVYSDKDLLLREEMSMNTFEQREVSLEVLEPSSVNISRHIDAYVFSPGDVSIFPQPKSHNKILGYYLMDAASVMPVIALDVHPTDNVLDLCAAPGGKSFLILQSLDLHLGGTLLCNDTSPSRIARLKNVLSSHFPPDIADQVIVTKREGSEAMSPVFNKVLVDVPCNADRHAVSEDENSMFKMSRTGERLELVKKQKQLLLSAIKSCVPGGTIVYSTCTLSPAQNDGVIQAAAEELWETSEIEFAVENLSPLASLFGHVFKFHQSRYGQIIVPNLLNNFGPAFLSKLKRIK